MQRVAVEIYRENLSGVLIETIRDMIFDGELPAGTRINELHLGKQLGVSRTPLREALALLAHEGALSNVPRIGWFVRPLTLAEFEQIYPMRPLLDPEALRLAGLPDAAHLKRLEALNRQIAAARTPAKAIALDDEWHLALIANCQNTVLLGLIGQFIRRTRRYETALFREHRNVAVATTEHDEVLDALRRRDLPEACAALRRNLQTGFAPIAAWLLAHEEKGR